MMVMLVVDSVEGIRLAPGQERATLGVTLRAVKNGTSVPELILLLLLLLLLVLSQLLNKRNGCSRFEKGCGKTLCCNC
jgi:hypothetical protein